MQTVPLLDGHATWLEPETKRSNWHHAFRFHVPSATYENEQTSGPIYLDILVGMAK
jgi:hypothetical protein